MNIVIIGSGNVAAILGRKFLKAGHSIVQIYSRNASAASELAYEWDTESTNYKSLIVKNADVYIIAVSDTVKMLMFTLLPSAILLLKKWLTT